MDGTVQVARLHETTGEVVRGDIPGAGEMGLFSAFGRARR